MEGAPAAEQPFGIRGRSWVWKLPRGRSDDSGKHEMGKHEADNNDNLNHVVW